MADEARVRKVQERILQTVASMIGRHVKDPRLELVTITDVRVTGDLQHASIFYTVLGDDEQRENALAKAKAKDEAIAAASAGATYAGDADPYRHDDEEDEGDAKEWA